MPPSDEVQISKICIWLLVLFEVQNIPAYLPNIGASRQYFNSSASFNNKGKETGILCNA